MRNPRWVKKWQELKKLIDKKYESHIAMTGLVLEEFREYKSVRLFLKIGPYSLFLGGGTSRLAAINEAINIVKKNQELISAFLPSLLNRSEKSPNCCIDQFVAKKEATNIVRIIEACQKDFQKAPH